MQKMGLKVPAALIDGTSSDENCLSDALVSVGANGRGGTGCFVSEDGLILTNWHVAHEAVRQASLARGTDLVEEGFVARSREEETRGPNCEVWHKIVDNLGMIFEPWNDERHAAKNAAVVAGDAVVSPEASSNAPEEDADGVEEDDDAIEKA